MNDIKTTFTLPDPRENIKQSEDNPPASLNYNDEKNQLELEKTRQILKLKEEYAKKCFTF